MKRWLGNHMPNGRSDEHKYPPGAVGFYRYIFGDYNTPIAIGPSPDQPVMIVSELPPPNKHANSFGVFGVAQSSHHLGSSSSTSRRSVSGPSNPTCYNSQLYDEALARTLQMEEMGDDFLNLSLQEPYWLAENQDNIDVDEMSYEQLQTLQETTGSVSKRLSEELISRLPSRKYKPPKKKGSSTDENKECPICMTEYQKGDVLTILPCTHQYHENCIQKWLKNNKTCCLCKKEAVPN